MARLQRNASPTIEDIYSVAVDAWEIGKKKEANQVFKEARAFFTEMTERPNSWRLFAIATKALEGGMVKGARRMLKEVREIYPVARVPQPLQRFFPFNEATVKREMANELDEDPDTFKITPSKLTFDIDIPGYGQYGRSYTVVRNEESAHDIAVSQVADNLKDDPEIFNEDFLLEHIDEEKLRDLVRRMVMEDEYWDEIAQHETERFWEDAEREGLDLPEPDEDGDMPSNVDQKYIDEMKERSANQATRDPLDYLSDMMGRPEALQFALDQVGIDIEAAAEAAVAADGPGHFVSSYDGELHDLPCGFTYWRTN